MTRAHDDDLSKDPAKPATHVNQRPENSSDLEFSDFGRDPKYPPAWWILPILVVAGIVAAVLIARFVL